MKYYIFIQNEKIIGKGQVRCLNDDITNIEVDADVYNNIEYFTYANGEIIINPNYEAEQAQKERERLDNLCLTAADVERAIYKAKGMDFEDLIALVEEQTANIDVKALKIELKANNFYRGNPYVNTIGELLGYSSDDLDYLFINKEFPNQSSEVNDDGMVL